MPRSFALERRFVRRCLLALALILVSSRSQAFVGGAWDYLRQYQFGIDYTSSYDGVTASYEVASSGGEPPRDCVQEAEQWRCKVHMKGAASSGFGFFLQQAFKRQGTFYFKPDIGFGARYLEGALSKEGAAEQGARGLPLQSMRFSLLSLVVKPYIQFGITPARTWPDLLISIGPAAAIGLGRVAINDKPENVAVATTSGRSLIGGFVELELVLWRFGDGAFSLFSSTDVTGGGEGSRFYPSKIDGMDDIRASFSRSVGGGVFGLGAKFLLNWP